MVNEQDVLTGVEARRERQQQHERERERAQHGTSTTTTTTKTPSVTTTIPPLVAAITRALIAPLYFYFRTPVKLFRPPRLSSLTVIRALAVSEGRPLDWPYVRALIRKEGVAECGRVHRALFHYCIAHYYYYCYHAMHSCHATRSRHHMIMRHIFTAPVLAASYVAAHVGECDDRLDLVHGLCSSGTCAYSELSRNE